MSQSRTASCRCGQLRAECRGEPVRVSACHCLECQKRTGSAFAVQARFLSENVTIYGESKTWERQTETETPAIYNFCGKCGSTVYYQAGPFPGMIAIPVGAFADPNFPEPSVSIYETRRHKWVQLSASGMKNID
ncbi:GFA family protein [Parasphingorhabdus sp. JC815]|uniref:GFA family protein n=1 Tax=Parasphingorhabdus sp. JC815 TaxID=3232140 RepID=UPI0034581644